jgi:DNA polymerase-3 subunit epsilon
MIENEAPKSLSLTALTKYINDTTGNNIHRDTVLYVLMKKKFVDDIKTITEEGFNNGVSYAYDRYRSHVRWPVYNSTIQDMFIKNIESIVPIDDKLRAKREAEKAEREAVKKAEKEAQRKAKHTHSSSPVMTIPTNGVTMTMNFKDENMKFPYLHLDDFVLIDTESSGLAKTDEVIELSVVDTYGNILYESTFRPTAEINPMASKVNGFTNKSLIDAPLFKDEWCKIEAAIDNRPIMCHNIGFDKRIIKQTCERYGISADVDFLFRNSYDSKEIAKDWMNAPDYSLETLAHMVGINEKESHRASDDCKMMLSFIERLERAIMLKNEVLK